MFAFLPSLGWPEMVLLLVIGLLLYGRNLPQAGRTMGRFVAQMKRGFQDFKDQMDRDESLREVKKTIQDTTREMRNLTAVPRAIADPTRAVRDLAHDAMAQTMNDSDVADEPPPAPASASDQAAPTSDSSSTPDTTLVPTDTDKPAGPIVTP